MTTDEKRRKFEELRMELLPRAKEYAKPWFDGNFVNSTCGPIASFAAKEILSREAALAEGKPPRWTYRKESDEEFSVWDEDGGFVAGMECSEEIVKRFVGMSVAEGKPAPGTPLPFPTKDDCRIVEAIMKAAKQIHEEFDCLSDHVKTKKQIREQISSIIWKHLDKARLAATPSPASIDDPKRDDCELMVSPNSAILQCEPDDDGLAAEDKAAANFISDEALGEMLPSCTICGKTMIFKCPNCSSTPELTSVEARCPTCGSDAPNKIIAVHCECHPTKDVTHSEKCWCTDDFHRTSAEGKGPRMMVSYPGLPSDEPHEECPDCRGQGCIPLETLKADAPKPVGEQEARGFSVKINSHTDALWNRSPEDIRFCIAHALERSEKPSLQEEVDFTLGVSRVHVA